MNSSAKVALRPRLEARAAALGLDAVRVADAAAPWPAAARLEAFLALGRHGGMGWLAETAARRGHPLALWPAARSAVMAGVSYAPEANPLALLAARDRGAIAAYAVRRDYHDVIKGRLKQLAQWLAKETGHAVKAFVDTAPLLEKPLAERAGLGWQGKHTNLVSRTHGSWLLLGAILTEAALPADAAETDHCGSCQACLAICPTAAFPAPYQLDARRCLAYLTIEHDGPIPRAFREPMGNRIFGCDDCLAVCPWNKFARTSAALLPQREALQAQPLADLARLDEAGFRAMFAGTPIKRTGRDRFVRNVFIAIGNSGRPEFAPLAVAALDDASALVRGAAIWALDRLLDRAAFAALRRERRDAEADADARAEWDGE